MGSLGSQMTFALQFQLHAFGYCAKSQWLLLQPLHSRPPCGTKLQWKHSRVCNFGLSCSSLVCIMKQPPKRFQKLVQLPCTFSLFVFAELRELHAECMSQSQPDQVYLDLFSFDLLKITFGNFNSHFDSPFLLE